MKILYDKDISTNFRMGDAIEALEGFFLSASQGNVVTPPRHSVTAGNGGLTFTIGAELETTNTIGFRVYDTYPGNHGADSDQIVAVYSTIDGHLKGLIIGSLLGAIRTAAIGGVAINYLSPKRIETAVIIGAGHQAKFQLQALMAVRKPQQMIFCNRTQSKAAVLSSACEETYGIHSSVSSDVEASVRQADIIICATSSPTPVIDSDWLKTSAYVASIGPKSPSRHELPIDISDRANLIVTDAKEQLLQYKTGYFLENTTSIQALEDVVAGKIKSTRQGFTVFLSSGRSGTEVVVANKALNNIA